MPWTPPDPFITEKQWQKYPLEAQQIIANINNRGFIQIWDQYFKEIRLAINSIESQFDLPYTIWTDLPYNSQQPYIWDKYIKKCALPLKISCPILTQDKIIKACYKDILDIMSGAMENLWLIIIYGIDV